MALYLILLFGLLASGGVQSKGRPEKFDDGTVGVTRGKMPKVKSEGELIFLTHTPEKVALLMKNVSDTYKNKGLLPPLFPGPEYVPGDILDSVDASKIDSALTEVLKAGSLLQGDMCAVGHANVEGRQQLDPRHYLYSGTVHSILPPSVAVGKTSLMLFTKDGVSFSGTVGVYTYDIEDSDYMIAVMWSAPYNGVLYDRWFNMKVYPKTFPVDKEMYEQMYYYAGPWRASGYEYRTEKGVHLKGTMTDASESKLVIWSNTTGFDENDITETHSDCSYNALWFGDYCWQECYPKGWCWVDRKCGSAADCAGPLECYSDC